MVKRKIAAWLWGIVALLFITSGLRDIFAPSFLNMSMNPQPKDILTIAFTFAVGVFFLAIAVSQALKARGERDISRT